MTLGDLFDLLHEAQQTPGWEKRELRVGDQIESGPYEHYPIGGIYRGVNGEVIVCGDPDSGLREEPQGIDTDIPVIWRP